MNQFTIIICACLVLILGILYMDNEKRIAAIPEPEYEFTCVAKESAIKDVIEFKCASVVPTINRVHKI